MIEWKKRLVEFESLLQQIAEKKEDRKGLLRFNRCTIRASDVAGQYYCEKKIELEYLYGEVETETKNQGSQAHENLLEGSEEVSREDLWKSVHSEGSVLALEWLLLARYGDIILVGKPDAVLFEDGFPLVVLEYKFSRSKRAYPSHHVQAGFYGILLKNIGFDVEKLYYAIIVADRSQKNDPNLKQRVVEAITENGPKNSIIPIENAVIYLNKFDEQAAASSLDWAIQFWKNQREATPTTNHRKCAVCEYKDQCETLFSD